MAIIIIGKSGRISILKRCLSVWKQRTQSRPSGVISARTAKLLNEYLHETEECGNEYVFLTYEGEKIGEATVRDNMRVYGQVAKITNKRVSPHTIRHTGALFYILNGGDPFSL